MQSMAASPIDSPRASLSVVLSSFRIFAALLLLSCVALPAFSFEPAEVRAIVARPRARTDYAGTGGIWNGLERSVRLDGQGNGQITEHWIAQVFDPAWGVKRFHPYVRSYWSRNTRPRVLLARVWHSLDVKEEVPPEAVTDSLAPEARGLPVCSYDRKLMIRFPVLKEGDMVELSLTWDVAADQDLLGTNYFAVAYGNEDPVIEQRTTVTHPAASQPLWRFFGPRLIRQAGDQGGMSSNTFIGGNLPAGRPMIETPWSRVPAEEDTLDASRSLLLFTTVGDWKQLIMALAPLWEESWKSRTAELDRKAGTAVSDHPDPSERARALEQMTQQEIRTVPVPAIQLGLVPVPAFEVERDRAGTPRDKTCYLVSLMRAAGLAAVPVLIHNKGGAADRDFPCPAQFDRYAVLVRLPEGADLWCDPLGDGNLSSPGFGLPLPPDDLGPPDPGLAGIIAFPGIALAESKRSF